VPGDSERDRPVAWHPGDTAMDGIRFDTLTRALTAAGSRRHAVTTALIGGLSLALGASSVEDAAAKKKPCPPCKKRKQGKCKKKLPDGTGCPGGSCQNGSCVAAAAPPPPSPPHPLVTCTMRNDPICTTETNCHCAVTGTIAETGSTRHCGSYGGSSDPCATAPRCPCPEGYICDLGAYSFGTCPDGGGRCAKNCG
jgi:hypothetical protein